MNEAAALLLDPTEELVFGLIEKAAIAGDRCPLNEEIWRAMKAAGLTMKRGIPDVLASLAKQGRIRGGVYTHNFRRLWICSGPNAGKATQAPPVGLRAYIIYDRFGVSRAQRRIS